MVRAYKALWNIAVQQGMRQDFASFAPVRVPKDDADARIFSGALLFRDALRPDACAWLTWRPGPGVERCFSVDVGWSRSSAGLPCLRAHDPRVYALRGPDPAYDAASLDLEQIEGRSAIGGVTIPSPWDRLLHVKAAAPRAELDAALREAQAESLALTEAQRAGAVDATLADVFARLRAILPGFRETLRNMA